VKGRVGRRVRSANLQTSPAERLQAFAEQLLQRYKVARLADLPRGPQADYKRAARQLGLAACGLQDE
jgi:hypothetical protein